jgi:hypothetical protein
MTRKNKFPKSHKFRGIKYKINWRKPPTTKKERKANDLVLGKCYPHVPGDARFESVIYVDPKIGKNHQKDEMDFMDTVLHEALHACFPDVEESAILDASASIWWLFKRMGMKVKFTKR